MTGRPVLFHPTGRYGRVLVELARAVSTLSALVTVLPIAALVLHQAAASLDPIAYGTVTLPEKERERCTHSPQAESEPDHRPITAALNNTDERSLSIGFYVNWDDNNYPALMRALPNLDWLIPGWLNLEGPTMDLKTNIDERALKYIRATKPNVAILPMIQNAVEGQWDGARLARLLANPTARAARIRDIVGFLETNKFQGLTVDFEEIPARAHNNLQVFLTEMSQEFAEHGLVIVLAVPFDDESWPYATYAKVADFLLLMGYDQHSEEGAPGSIAGQNWFKETLAKRMKDLDPDRTIIAIGGYGYDWVRGKMAEDLSFEDAILSARDSEADILFDPKSANPHFSFVEDDGKHHHVWFLDGVTAFNEIHAADTYRPIGYAVWRLGGEDPSIWSVLGRAYGMSAPEALRVIGTAGDINFEGNGKVSRVAEKPADVTRTFEVDNQTGEIVDQVYKMSPLPAHKRFVYASVGIESGRPDNPLDTRSFPLDVSVSYNHSLTHPEQQTLGYLFDDMDRPVALRFREISSSQGLAAAKRFSGHAVRCFYADAETPSPAELAASTR